MKALGIELNDFYNNHWPEDCEHEDYNEDVLQFDERDRLNLEEDKLYSLDAFGWIYSPDGSNVRFETAYKKYVKGKYSAYLIVEVDKENLKAVVEIVKEALSKNNIAAKVKKV